MLEFTTEEVQQSDFIFFLNREITKKIVFE